MLILTGVNGNKVRVYDTDDGSNEVVIFTTLVNKVREANGKLRVYGLRLYNQNEVYPVDSYGVSALGVVVIPSEAREAAKRYGLH